MSLEVINTKRKELEYPMDNPEEFETIEDFINFNLRELEEIADIEFDYVKVISALENREWIAEKECNGILYIVVRI